MARRASNPSRHRSTHTLDRVDEAPEREKPQQASVELNLAGDFGSPAEVLASKELSTTDKRAILRVWQRDLEARREQADARRLLASVLETLDNLAHEDQAQPP